MRPATSSIGCTPAIGTRRACLEFHLPTNTKDQFHCMTTYILRYRWLVVLVWIVLSVVSIATAGRIGPRLDYTYTTPGEPGYEANLKVAQRFGLDAEFESTLPVLRLPEGLTMDSAEARAAAAKTFAAAYQAGPLAVVD